MMVRLRLRWFDPFVGVAVGVLCLLFMGAPLLPADQVPPDIWKAPLVYNILQFGLPLVLALRLADAAIERGASPTAAYTAAVLVVVVGGVFVIGPALMPWLGSDPGWSFSNDLWLATGVGVLLALMTAGYARWRGGQRTMARARHAEAARAEQARQVQAARLLALQAQVEPQLLFDALGRVSAHMAHDTASADQLLADTIALLRGLLPAGQIGSSTLGRELELVALRARVTDDAALQPPLLVVRVDPALAGAALAPALVPDLLRSLTAAHAGWTLNARGAGDAAAPALHLHVAAQAPAPAAAAALAALDTPALQEQLRAVHGGSARLWADAAAGTLALELPLVTTADEP